MLNTCYENIKHASRVELYMQYIFSTNLWKRYHVTSRLKLILFSLNCIDYLRLTNHSGCSFTFLEFISTIVTLDYRSLMFKIYFLSIVCWEYCEETSCQSVLEFRVYVLDDRQSAFGTEFTGGALSMVLLVAGL